MNYYPTLTVEIEKMKNDTRVRNPSCQEGMMIEDQITTTTSRKLTINLNRKDMRENTRTTTKE